ncbi:MAG: nuclear transport factor 2 family protein [Alphaproteobacteria bacterium]|nr:nuclear transport factor 2 family protein [Alphaproteobacteria bacterium]MDE2071799.1 nuclear transport factor 2 family protein [Alphaproteobacteria bacterium]
MRCRSPNASSIASCSTRLRTDRRGKGRAGLTQAEFTALLARLGAAANAGDGKAFAACFTEDGLYHDYIYGPHQGRAAIMAMLENLFHRDATDYDWRFLDPVCHGEIGYARSLSRFVSTIPEFAGREVVIDGISRFVLKDGLIAEYHESVNGGVAMAQLGVEPARMAKVMRRWAERFLARDDIAAYRAAFRK